MNKWAIRLVALGGFLMFGAELQAHHAVASAYDLNKDSVKVFTALPRAALDPLLAIEAK